ncbi:MAG TPA: universal stress protein [Acidimicrobiales bacterium]|nr:universal stress protein [Acidimicrobiales bacterium]
MASRQAGSSDGQPRIVVGVDGSEFSDLAIERAAEEAEHRGAVLEIHTAWGSGSTFLSRGEVTMALQRIGAEARERVVKLAPEVPTRVVIHEGAPAPALIKASEGADLLVVGSRGLGGFKGMLLGSVSHQCALHAKCPVLVVR